jgi:hypothetical protein
MPPLGRESDGLIQSVDRKDKILTIRIEGESRLQSFEWNKETRFVQDQKFTTSDRLKAGAAVRIRYHAPIFGKPYLTRVLFLKPALKKRSFSEYPAETTLLSAARLALV